MYTTKNILHPYDMFCIWLHTLEYLDHKSGLYMLPCPWQKRHNSCIDYFSVIPFNHRQAPCTKQVCAPSTQYWCNLKTMLWKISWLVCFGHLGTFNRHHVKAFALTKIHNIEKNLTPWSLRTASWLVLPQHSISCGFLPHSWNNEKVHFNHSAIFKIIPS